MANPGLYCAAALLAALGVHRFAIGRRSQRSPAESPVSRRAPVHRYVGGFCGCFVAFLVLIASNPGAAIDRAAGLTGMSILLGDLLRMGSVGCLALLAIALHQPADALGGATGGIARHTDDDADAAAPGAAVAAALRWYQVVGTLPIVLAVLLFLLARTRAAGAGVVGTGPTGRIALSGYNLVVTCYAAWCLAVVLRATMRWTRQAETPPLRIALGLITLSIGVGLLWTAWGLDDVIDSLRSGWQQTAEDRLSMVMGRLCVVLLLAGATALPLARTPRAVRGWFAAYHVYRSLGPLWQALRAVFPQITLLATAHSRRTLSLDAHLALYRRVIEIHDGLLLLRRYRTAELPDWATEVLADSALADRGSSDAEVAAATIAVALVRAAAGEEAERCTPTVSACPVAGHVKAEEGWLAEVSDALQRSSAVARVRARALSRVGDWPGG